MKTATQHPIPLRGMIAIVDDDANISYALKSWLALYDIEVTLHESAESLLNHLHANDHDHDLTVLRLGTFDATYVPLLGAILDVNLPGMTGFELAKALRQLNPQLPLAMMTALSPSERKKYATMSNITCLTKPFDLNALENALFPLFYTAPSPLCGI